MNRDLLMYFGNPEPPIYLSLIYLSYKCGAILKIPKLMRLRPTYYLNRDLLLLMYFVNSQSPIYL